MTTRDKLDRIAVGTSYLGDLRASEIEDLLTSSISQKVFSRAARAVLEQRPDLEGGSVAGRALRRLSGALRHNTQIFEKSPKILEAFNCAGTPQDLLNAAESVRRLITSGSNRIIELASRAGYRWALLKGRSIGVEDRDQGDLDIWMPDVAEAIRLIETLRGKGASLHDVAVYKLSSDEPCLKFHMFTSEGLLVEVHAGSLQGYAGGIVNSATSEVDGINVLSDEGMFVYLLTHLLRDGRVISRDLLDFQAIIGRVSPFASDVRALTGRLGLRLIAEALAGRATRAGLKGADSLWQRGVITRSLADLMGRDRKPAHASFQFGALPGQLEYMRAYGADRRTVLSDCGVRFSHGIERALFPGMDGRVERVPRWRAWGHACVFGPGTWDCLRPMYFEPMTSTCGGPSAIPSDRGDVTMGRAPSGEVWIRAGSVVGQLLDYYKHPIGVST